MLMSNGVSNKRCSAMYQLWTRLLEHTVMLKTQLILYATLSIDLDSKIDLIIESCMPFISIKALSMDQELGRFSLRSIRMAQEKS